MRPCAGAHSPVRPALPDSRRLVLKALFAAIVSGTVLLALVLVGCTNLMLGVRPFVHIVSLTAITALVFPLTALALSYGTFYPQFDTENAAQIPTSFGGLLFMMTAIVLIGAVAYLTGRPAARFVVAEHFGWARTPTDMLLPFALAATACSEACDASCKRRASSAAARSACAARPSASSSARARVPAGPSPGPACVQPSAPCPRSPLPLHAPA